MLIACILLCSYALTAPIIAEVTVTELKSLQQEADMCADKEDFTRAIELYKQCYTHNYADVHSIFKEAICLLKIGRIDEAIARFESLIPRLQNPGTVRYNIAYAYKIAGKLDTAIKLYEEIVAQKPDDEQANLGLGFAYIQNGDFIHGWPQHSKHLKKVRKNGDQLRELLAQNMIAGKKILLHYEGGLGDTLMFVRYAERLKKLGGIITCMVQEQLIPLLSHCPYIDFIIPYSPQQLAFHDAHASLMSLPAIFGDTEDRFSLAIPYLYPDPELIDLWHNRVASYAGMKIGICWQSDVYNDISRLPIARRGLPLTALEPLLRIPGVTYISLQRHDGTEQIEMLPPDCTLITYQDLDTEHGCFMDTAALMQQLDLVISIDSAVAHLAGGLGVPTFLLLPYNTDWRWIIDRTDSPWYPHHHIFKQPAPFDWHSVVNAVQTYLESVYLLKKDLL